MREVTPEKRASPSRPLQTMEKKKAEGLEYFRVPPYLRDPTWCLQKSLLVGNSFKIAPATDDTKKKNAGNTISFTTAGCQRCGFSAKKKGGEEKMGAASKFARPREILQELSDSLQRRP